MERSGEDARGAESGPHGQGLPRPDRRRYRDGRCGLLRQSDFAGSSGNRGAAAQADGRQHPGRQQRMRRRSFLQGLVPALAVTALPRSTLARSSEPADLTVTPLGERLFVISGGGGNVTVLNSPEGVLLVDGGSP